MSIREIRLAVELDVPAGELWRSICRLDAVNRELAPWLRMTTRGLAAKSIDELDPGRPAGRSWLLLGGLIPVEYDDLCLAEIEPPHRFLERSRMLTVDLWEHERTIQPRHPDSSLLADRLRFRLRGSLASVPGAERVAAAVVAALFRHRHRRLAKLHGVPDPIRRSHE